MSSTATTESSYDLLSGITWNADLPSTTVTYYFFEAGETLLIPEEPDDDDFDDDDDEDDYTSVGWTDYEAQQLQLAMTLYANVTGLEFVAVDSAEEAMLKFVAADFGPDSYGDQGLFLPPDEALAGLGIFNVTGFGWERELDTGSISQGGLGFDTIVHELGHGLGLAHPHDDGGDSTVFPGVEDSDDLGVYDFNQQIYTVMTYNDGWVTSPYGLTPDEGFGWGGTPMAIDIAALQAKYGINPEHNGDDTVYVLPQENGVGTYYGSIWDTGGADTILHEGNDDARIDLRPASLEFEPGGGGHVSYVDGIYGGFVIAHGVTIENAVGGSGNDWFVGNDADNTIDGGAGLDHMEYHATRDAHTVQVSDQSVLIGGATGTDTLIDIERVVFTDGTLAFDVDDAPGQVFRLYQAAFDREADADGLGYWIATMEQQGHDLTWVAENFVQSNEFATTYAPIDTLDAATYVDLLYQNVLSRSEDAGGASYWEDRLDDGMSAAAVLASFAESAENEARTAEQTADGVWFA